MTSRRQREQPDHHIEYYPNRSTVFNDEFYPITDDINPVADDNFVDVATTPTTITIEDSSIVQADTLTPITPPDSTPPSQHQEDSYRLKAKKSLDFTDPRSEKM